MTCAPRSRRSWRTTGAESLASRPRPAPGRPWPGPVDARMPRRPLAVSSLVYCTLVSPVGASVPSHHSHHTDAGDGPRFMQPRYSQLPQARFGFVSFSFQSQATQTQSPCPAPCASKTRVFQAPYVRQAMGITQTPSMQTPETTENTCTGMLLCRVCPLSMSSISTVSAIVSAAKSARRVSAVSRAAGIGMP